MGSYLDKAGYWHDTEMEKEDLDRVRLQSMAKARYFEQNPGNENQQSVRDRIAKEEAVKGGYYDPRMESVVTQARMSQIQAKAEFDAANFEKRYTAKQKAMISQNEAAFQSFANDPRNSPQEIDAARKLKEYKNLGISPALLPRVSQYAPGQGIGDSWMDPVRGAVTRQNSGDVINVPFTGTPGALAAQHAHDLEKEQAKIKGKQDAEYLKAIWEAAKDPLAIPDPTAEDPGRKRARTVQEQKDYVDEMLNPRSRVPAGQKYESNAEMDAAKEEWMRKNPGQPLPDAQPEQTQLKSFGKTQNSVSTGTVVVSDADYAKVPPGTEFTGPDGKRYFKPKRK